MRDEELDATLGEQAQVRQSMLRTVPFRDDMIGVIAETIGAEPGLAPFQLPGAAVYQFLVSGSSGRPSAMVTLWPSLKRVDAIGTGAAIVFTRIDTVQLVADVEILFRRGTSDYLVIAKGGKLVVRT